ncbi:MAG: hypothetical protein KDD58_05650 [Bdellovibrionales bacterium]|nr:hypothetical protein [Bdellovibrionales bacterium]
MKTVSPAVERYLKIIARDCDSFKSQLRVLRHKYWIEAASNTLNNSCTAKNICYQWSLHTDEIIQKAWEYCGLNQFPLCLLALGKWGARELNLSSDIDFFIVSDRPVTKEYQKVLNAFLNTLNENNEFGFCYRTDMDLRPGGRFGPTIHSLSQVQDYYWNSGATWEKVALVRMRYVCGDQSIFKELSHIISSFVYRKYLDFTLFEDLKSLRFKIHSSYKEELNTNLKLHPGGIRDIELFVNSLQVIHGGRLPSLRTTSTSEAIQIISEGNLFEQKILCEMEDLYWSLRELENTVQAKEDRQTHSIFLDENSNLLQRMKTIDKTISQLIGFEKSNNDKPVKGEAAIQRLLDMGFNEHSANNVWPDIISFTSKSIKTESAEQARTSFLNEFLESLALRPFGKDLGLELLREFIKSTRAKATFFTTLLRDPTLIKDLAYIFSSSAYIGNFVAARPELIDSLILSQESSSSSDLEDFLVNLVEKKKLKQIYAVIEFLKTKDVLHLCNIHSQIADDICINLINRLKKEYNLKSNLEIIALGKWGGNELGIESDLDMLFVTPTTPQDDDFKLAKRFLSRLSEQQKSGMLYSYDLRLRPSGNSGPLLVSYDQLNNYLLTSAKAWEKQSFLRARAIFPASPLKNLYQNYIQLGLTSAEEIELNEILEKLLVHKLKPNRLNIKYQPGGLVNIELVIQKLILKYKIDCSTSSLDGMLLSIQKMTPPHTNETINILSKNYSFLRKVEQMYQVKSSHSGSEFNLDSESFEQVCLELDLSPEELISEVKECLYKNRNLLKSLSKV